MNKKLLYYFGVLILVLISCKKLERVNPKDANGINFVVLDIDGNSYKTVKIGNQTWIAENLKTTKFNDGTSIPNVTDATQWSELTTAAWCNYNNSDSLGKIYGKLYNWYAVSPTTNGNKNVCPTGWHVPTDAEWTVLTDYLGGEAVAGGKMKEIGTTNWSGQHPYATNESGFTGLLGGYRGNGFYYHIGYYGVWWSSTENLTSTAWTRHLNDYSNGDAYGNHYDKGYGFSVRCLRD